MRAFIRSVAAVSILLSPLSTLAAPTVEQVTTETIVSRDFSPHTDCYADGEQFQNLSEWSNVNATVMAGCDTFATYNAHVFNVGDEVGSPKTPFHFLLDILSK